MTAHISYCERSVTIGKREYSFDELGFDRTYDAAMFQVELEDRFGCPVKVYMSDIYEIRVKRGITYIINTANPEEEYRIASRMNVTAECDRLNAFASGLI
jgi:hypothetical protein